MKKLFFIIIILAVITSCGSKKTETVTEEVHQDETASNLVSITEAQM